MSRFLQPVPWWAFFVLCMFMLFKVGMQAESPCAVLGTPSPVTKKDISAAYRKVSMCTHPDRLVGASTADRLRGRSLFERATRARDEMMKELKQAKKETGATQVACIGSNGELENEIYGMFAYFLGGMADWGWFDYWTFCKEFVVSLISMDGGIVGFLSTMLLLSFVWRMAASLGNYVKATGPLQLIFSAILALVVGPFPTIFRFVASPIVRVQVWVQDVFLPHFKKEQRKHKKVEKSMSASASEQQAAQPEAQGAAEVNDEPTEEEQEMKAAKAKLAERSSARKVGGLRRRGKTEKAQTKEEIEQQRQTMLITPVADGGNQQPFSADADADADDAERNRETLEEQIESGVPTGQIQFLSAQSLRRNIARIPLKPNMMRTAAAGAIQFSYLLTLTKPVIPLVCLVATGQVFSGLFSSLFMSHVLRNWVPAMRSETLHVGLVFFGLIHTWMNINESQLAAQGESGGMLHLQWAWSFRDVTSVGNVVHMGALFSNVGQLGNEPMMCTSFAAGVALRMVLHELTPRWIVKPFTKMLHEAKVVLHKSDDIAARSFGRVGSCAGGPLRMMSPGGDAVYAEWIAVGVKSLLLVLPVLALAQWSVRAKVEYNRLQREKQRSVQRKDQLAHLRKLVRQQVLMAVAMAFLVVFFITFQLNAINSSLANFLVLVLVG